MKKSLKKQAVFPVLMLLVVTALALIGSSFAWFSMASTASVTTIEGTVEDAGLGLMISQDATNFYSNVTMGDDASTFVRPATFRQVSTTNAVNFFDAEIVAKNASGIATSIKTSTNDTVYTNGGQMFGRYYNDANPAVIQNMTISNAQYVLASDGSKSFKGTTGAVANEASYMVFDLFFQAENAGNLYLDYGTALTSTKNSKAAMRVAFLSYATASTGADAIAATSVSSTTIWEPYATTSGEPATKVVTYGVTAASSDAFAPYSDVSGKTGTQTTYISDQLFNSTTAWNTDTNIPNDDNIQKIATLASGVTKVRVVVWLEGNDPDCISAIASDTLSLTLKFFAKKTTA